MHENIKQKDLIKIFTNNQTVRITFSQILADLILDEDNLRINVWCNCY